MYLRAPMLLSNRNLTGSSVCVPCACAPSEPRACAPSIKDVCRVDALRPIGNPTRYALPKPNRRSKPGRLPARRMSIARFRVSSPASVFRCPRLRGVLRRSVTEGAGHAVSALALSGRNFPGAMLSTWRSGWRPPDRCPPSVELCGSIHFRFSRSPNVYA